MHFDSRRLRSPENSIFVSRTQRDRLKPSGRYIHNPVDAGKYEYRTEKQRYLSFLARLDRSKGVDIAIRVAKASGIPLKIAGNISQKEFFEAEVEPHLDDHVEYVGQVGGKEKSDLLGKSMATLYPTRLDPEPFGRVPLEANACGTPAVAFGSGGLREVVRHGNTGFLVDSESEMVAALDKVAGLDPAVCRKWVVDHFHPATIAQRHVELYQDLVSGKTWG